MKTSEISDLIYHKKNRDFLLNKGKGCYKNNKERLKEQARDKYRRLPEEEKSKKREYLWNRYHNMSEEKKQRLKEYQKEYQKNYRKESATNEHYAQNKEAIEEKLREHYKNLSREEKGKISENQRKRYQQLVQYKKKC